MRMISSISHMTFIVKDLERSALFFKKIFGAAEVYASGEKTFSLSKEKFLLIGDLWICLMEGEPLQARTYNHIAFQVKESEIDIYRERIRDAGGTFRPERSRVTGEGRSLYFYDFDNHLFELHAGSLEERLARYREES